MRPKACDRSQVSVWVGTCPAWASLCCATSNSIIGWINSIKQFVARCVRARWKGGRSGAVAVIPLQVSGLGWLQIFRGKIARAMVAVQLLFQDFFPSQLARTARAGNAEQQGSVGCSRQSIGLQGRGANILVRQVAELLAKAGNDLIEQRRDRCNRGFLMTETRTAIANNDIDFRVQNPLAEQGADGVDIVPADGALHAVMAAVSQAGRQVIAGGVIIRTTAVRNGQHSSVQANSG